MELREKEMLNGAGGEEGEDRTCGRSINRQEIIV